MAVCSVLPIQAPWEEGTAHFTETALYLVWGWWWWCSQWKAQQDGNHASACPVPSSMGFLPTWTGMLSPPSWMLWWWCWPSFIFLFLAALSLCGENTSASASSASLFSPMLFFLLTQTENYKADGVNDSRGHWFGRWRMPICKSLCLRHITGKDSKLRKSRSTNFKNAIVNRGEWSAIISLIIGK